MRDEVKTTQMNHALKVAFETHDEKFAANCIEALQEKYPDFLSWNIQNGQNVLIFALVNNLPRLVKKLLAEPYDLNLLTQEDCNKRNFIWHAFNLDEQQIIKPIVDWICQENQQEALFNGDIKNNTLLHCAAKHDGTLLTYLFNNLKTENFPNLINQTNEYGDTPLHTALKRHSYSAILFLINQGANLLLINNNKKSPVSLLLELSDYDNSIFFQIMNQIKPQQKSIILQKLRQDLADHPSDSQLKKYFKINGLSNLQQLLIAHHEFNPEIPLRDHYTLRRLKQTIQKQNGIYQNIYDGQMEEVECQIEDSILEQMPIYAKRLGFLTTLNPESAFTNEIDLLNHDRISLLNLINTIDNVLQDVNQEDRLSFAEKFISSMAALAALSFLASLSFAVIEDSMELYYATIFGAFCLVGIGCAALDAAMICKLQKIVRKLSVDLKEIINQLDSLSESQRNNLITETDFAILQQEWGSLKKIKTKAEISPIVNHSKDHINKLLKNLNRTHQPISSRFFQPKKAAVNNNHEHIIDINDERQPLLRPAMG